MASAARLVDAIGVRPAWTQEQVDQQNARFAGVNAASMLRTLLSDGTLGKVAVVSSFGTESAVLLHLVASVDTAVPVIFVDTLRMFPETLAYRDLLIERFGIGDSRVVLPDPAVLAARDAQELRWSYDP